MTAMTDLELDIAVARALGYQVRDGRWKCRQQCVGSISDGGDFPSVRDRGWHYHGYWEYMAELDEDSEPVWRPVLPYSSNWGSTGPLIHELEIGVDPNMDAEELRYPDLRWLLGRWASDAHLQTKAATPARRRLQPHPGTRCSREAACTPAHRLAFGSLSSCRPPVDTSFVPVDGFCAHTTSIASGPPPRGLPGWGGGRA